MSALFVPWGLLARVYAVYEATWIWIWICLYVCASC
jgi:hypothetical protein